MNIRLPEGNDFGAQQARIRHHVRHNNITEALDEMSQAMWPFDSKFFNPRMKRALTDDQKRVSKELCPYVRTILRELLGGTLRGDHLRAICNISRLLPNPHPMLTMLRSVQIVGASLDPKHWASGRAAPNTVDVAAPTHAACIYFDALRRWKPDSWIEVMKRGGWVTRRTSGSRTAIRMVMPHTFPHSTMWVEYDGKVVAQAHMIVRLPYIPLEVT